MPIHQTGRGVGVEVAIAIALAGLPGPAPAEKVPPGYQRVSGKNAIKLLDGSAIGTLPESQPEEVPATETFNQDFTWRKTTLAIVAQINTGKWSVTNDLLCISSNTGQAYCREVWAGRDPTIIMLSYPKATNKINIYHKYRLRKY